VSDDLRDTRALTTFVAGASISNAGSFMQATAVPFVLYRLTGSNVWVGAAAFAALTFPVLMSPVGGILVDRFSQKSVLVTAQWVQIAPALALAGLAATDALRPWPTVILVAIGGVGAGLQFPASQSFVPTLVPAARVATGVRWTTLGLTVSRTVGPALAGILLTVTGATTLFAVNATTFVVYLVLLRTLRPRPTTAHATDGSWLHQYRAAIAYVRARPGIVALLGIGVIGACFGPSLSFLVPGIAARFGAGAGGTGALATAYGIGAILGATAIVRTGDRIPRATATRLGYVGFGVGEIAAMGTRSLAVGLVAFVVAGVGYSLWLTSIGTAFQVQITDAFRGRLTGFYIAAVVGGTPVGAVLGGWLGDRVGLGPVFVAYGTILLLLATLGARRLRFGLLDRATPLPD